MHPNPSSLSKKLSRIRSLFPVQDIKQKRMDLEYVASYYKTNRLAYSLFHTMSDAMYMGISRDGKYKQDDLYEAARTVEKFIRPNQTKHILELATGRGATSAFLAKKYASIEFDGIDISQGQLDFAYKKARRLKTYHPQLGDYHDLHGYENEYFDIIFVIEALCYSKNKEKVLKEVKRVLKPHGIFIILDGYRNHQITSFTQDEEDAMELTQRGMAVETFETYESFRSTAKKAGFSLVSEENASEYILPTLYRFERTANFFVSIPLISQMLVKIFPSQFTWNAISALLMPELIKRKLACYYITVLRR
jgi:ubiquinone/menaquinone biosynthesis C-methylase UbiE